MVAPEDARPVLAGADLEVADTTDKAFRTVQAIAAMHGTRVDAVHAGIGRVTFVVQRWGRARDYATLDDVRRVLANVGIEA